LKDSVRTMPQLEFYEDDTLKTALHLDELFNQIRANESRPENSVASEVE
jgi:ribosome-binding factor A